MGSNDIDNICAVLIHESLHLKILMSGIVLDPNEEEALCYSYERSFLLKVPCINAYLIKHAENQILIMNNVHIGNYGTKESDIESAGVEDVIVVEDVRISLDREKNSLRGVRSIK